MTREQAESTTMVKELNRWCPIQTDVEDYLHKTLAEVRVCDVLPFALIIAFFSAKYLRSPQEQHA